MESTFPPLLWNWYHIKIVIVLYRNYFNVCSIIFHSDSFFAPYSNKKHPTQFYCCIFSTHPFSISFSCCQNENFSFPSNLHLNRTRAIIIFRFSCRLIYFTDYVQHSHIPTSFHFVITFSCMLGGPLFIFHFDFRNLLRFPLSFLFNVVGSLVPHVTL